MHPAIGQLLELQRLDQLIAGYRADLETLPKKLKEADAKLNGAKAAVASAKEALAQGQTQRRKFEGEVEQWRERAKKYRAQSASVKTNEAYKALQHEIATADGEASKAEDSVLDQMMAIEESERRAKHFEADLREAEAAVSAEKKRIETQYGEEKKKLEAATAERAEISGKAPQELVELYTRVSKRHPGTVMAEVRDGQCKGCGLRILPHVIQLLTTDTDEEVFRCESCGRILYTQEPIPHASPPQSSEAGAANGASHS
jgi:predicted  nucleic acid-binding Zn-ribbon protein